MDGKIIFKKFIYDSGNTVKYISSVNPFMVIGCGRCDGKIFSFVPVPRDIYKFGSNFILAIHIISPVNRNLITILVNPLQICYAVKYSQ